MSDSGIEKAYEEDLQAAAPVLCLFVNGTLKETVPDTPSGRVRMDKAALLYAETSDCVEVRKAGSEVPDRFWNHVVQGETAECWEWSGSRTPKGYGRMWTSDGSIRAHRYAWELEHGPVPEGMCVLHHCDNPPCVNPDHLWLGTVAENNADRAAKGRTVPMTGERNGRAILTDAQAEVIRERLARGESQSEIARDYGVGRWTIGDMARGKTRSPTRPCCTPKPYAGPSGVRLRHDWQCPDHPGAVVHSPIAPVVQLDRARLARKLSNETRHYGLDDAIQAHPAAGGILTPLDGRCPLHVLFEADECPECSDRRTR